MNEEKWRIVKQIFNEAVELSLGSQTEFLDSATDDEEILSEVKKLIVAQNPKAFEAKKKAPAKKKAVAKKK